MMMLLIKVNGAAVEVVSSGPVAEATENGAIESAVNAISTGEPISFWAWAVIPLTVALLWYFFASKPYTPRRYRRTIGAGPLTHFRGSIARKFNSFLS